MISKATATWKGGFKDGKGTMKPAHTAEAGFTLGSRFEGQPSTNPEEFIGAALSGCYAMALTAGLEQAGFAPKEVNASAEVTIERQGSGFSITNIALSVQASVGGVSEERFQSIADETKRGCPVSKALHGTNISLAAKLRAM